MVKKPKLRGPTSDLTAHQRKELEKLKIGDQFKPWGDGIKMRIPTAVALEKKRYLKIVRVPKHMPCGYTVYQRIR